MHELHELRERLCAELKKYGTKDLSTGSLDVVDKLTHAIKNLDKVIEASDGEYSSRGYGGYNDGYGYGRDRMGRYSRYDHSRSSLGDKLREMMNDAPDEQTRMELQRLADKM